MEHKGIAGRLLQQTRYKIALILMGLAQHVIHGVVAAAQRRTDQYPFAELQLPQMFFDLGEILVAEFLPKHCEQSRESIRLEFFPMTIGNSSQRFQHAREHLQHADRSAEDAAGIAGKEAEIILPFAFDGFDRELIDIPHDPLMLQTVPEDVL